MEALVELLNNVTRQKSLKILREQDHFFTEAVTSILQSKEYDINEDIGGIFLQTKDESKRIHLLADYIRCEYVEFMQENISEELYKWSRNLSDEKMQGFIRNLADWLDTITFSVDCYEVAKTLISRYKKQKGISGKKGKRDLTLLKKSA